MESPRLNVVTGAFGYTGKHITERLLSMGERVTTLTGHPRRHDPFGGQVSVAPLDFDNRWELVESLRGATTLYNTYWIRFPRGQTTFEGAVANTRIFISAAREAGVQKIVHISITGAWEDSPLPYFSGKSAMETAVMESGLSYGIIRPTVIFGHGDILINNIAWFLRRFPVFAVFGSGDYRVQPVAVEDVAEAAVDAGHSSDNTVKDAVGIEVYTFDELIRLIAEKVHSRARIVHMRPGLALFLCRLAGFLVNDVVLTREEVEGLMSNLLVSTEPATGKTRVSDWLSENAGSVGTKYASELERHFR